jgi:hypothetical protein
MFEHGNLLWIVLGCHGSQPMLEPRLADFFALHQKPPSAVCHAGTGAIIPVDADEERQTPIPVLMHHIDGSAFA